VDEAWYRLGMVVVLFLGVWEGVIAIIFRVFTDKGPNPLVAVNYLPGPWCYVVAVAAVVTAFVVIAVLETRRKEVLARKDT
jgi:hypothetical protein